ncbi:MAG: 50S ribosomal protein L13 [Bacteroidetes bacterium]|nr:50S ribosomal protein L13 [Bacteroidota bacterium]
MKTSARITKHLRKEDVNRKWWVIDAKEQTIGRIASQAATLLRGKHKSNFTSHVDNGDYVIIINAAKAIFKGKRATQKEYFHHTMYPGGLKKEKYTDLVTAKPEFAMKHAINGMLPKTRLGSSIRLKLKVYADEKHEHQAQKPEFYTFK